LTGKGQGGIKREKRKEKREGERRKEKEKARVEKGVKKSGRGGVSSSNPFCGVNKIIFIAGHLLQYS
jgi:hypothetical protein